MQRARYQTIRATGPFIFDMDIFDTMVVCLYIYIYIYYNIMCFFWCPYITCNDIHARQIHFAVMNEGWFSGDDLSSSS